MKPAHLDLIELEQAKLVRQRKVGEKLLKTATDPVHIEVIKLGLVVIDMYLDMLTLVVMKDENHEN